ncbi:bifunctional nuclease family protein [Brevibacterium yomogidense]|uniref:bifunctional nuclease family protein n=1 Tax=Brevibacterium yomogidense TaxID=946573 RepID=UPI0018E007E5|nr:bifunctional nuclease family protein [Brevibacterium yomogidense]
MADLEVEVVGIRIELPANQPILVLKAVDRPRYLPIWIGSNESALIQMTQKGLVTARPLTHQLLIDVLDHYGARIERVTVTGREEHTFYARIDTSDGKRISARPSDAVLLALTADAPVYVAESVLDADGIDAPEPDEEAVAQFREFLDHVSAEDFGADEGADPASSEDEDGTSEEPSDTQSSVSEAQGTEQDDTTGGDDTTDDGPSADDAAEGDEDSR